uniref:CSON003108 protein n=2 Tax=Culicoides sonorensis TaxID=179676 RepID=A0A336MYM1_CULSO
MPIHYRANKHNIMGIFDNIWRNSLTITVVACSVLVTVSNAAPFSKYGRRCQDIGCLPSEVCVMSQDACSFGQRDGKDCGSYPTCKKQGAAGTSNTNNRGQGVYTLNPAPDGTRYGNDMNGRPPAQFHPPTVDPNQIFGQPPAWSGYPHYQAPITPPPGISNYPHYPPNPNSGYMGQFPPPPYYGGSKSSGTANQPSLLDQFLYNKRGGKNDSTLVRINNIAMTLLTSISFIAFKLLLLR